MMRFLALILLAVVTQTVAAESAVEFTIDVSEAPELKEWTEKAVGIAVKWYPRMVEELKSDGYVPPNRIHLVFKKSYSGVAATSGNRIVCSPDYFSKHKDDFGAIIHETAHVVQGYRGGNTPGWLVEGIADYFRFFKYEPENQPKRLNPDRVKYTDSYRISAAFLAFVADKYDKDLVRKLNAALRERRYEDGLFQKLTGKNLKELETEWKSALRS